MDAGRARARNAHRRDRGACARALRCDIAAWWRQTVEQADTGERPVLFFRQDRDDWRAVWPLSVRWLGYEMTAEGSVEAWAAAARETTTKAQSNATEIVALDKVSAALVSGSVSAESAERAAPLTALKGQHG